MPSITDLFVTKSSFVVRKSRFAVRSDIRFSTLLHHHMGLFENRVQTWWFFIMFPIQLLVCDIKANPGSVTDQLTNWMGYQYSIFIIFAITVLGWFYGINHGNGHPLKLDMWTSNYINRGFSSQTWLITRVYPILLFFSYPHHIPNMHPIYLHYISNIVGC